MMMMMITTMTDRVHNIGLTREEACTKKEQVYCHDNITTMTDRVHSDTDDH